MSAPCPSLKQYYSTEADRCSWVGSLFDRTAADYERVERAMTCGTGSWYRRGALRRAGLARGMRVIDVGVGTGLVAREAVRLVGEASYVTGIDPSPGMVQEARVPAGVRLMEGCAEAIPMPSACADFVSMGYALRHVSDLGMVFAEFWRVLRPGGIVCLLEITQPRGAVARALLKSYMNGIVPVLARLVARHPDTPKLMRFYWDTIEACAAPQAIMREIEQARFESVTRHVELGVFSEYCARKPRATETA